MSKIDNELVLASDKGEVDRVKDLLDQGADVNYLDWEIDKKIWSETPLTAAAGPGRTGRNLGNRVATVRALLSAGADVNLKDQSTRTPLMWAAISEDVAVIETLIEAGASLDMQDNWGATALHAAAANSYSEGLDDVVQVLLDAGASATIVNRYGETAEDLANSEIRDILIAHRVTQERNTLRQAAGIADQDPAPPARRRL